MTEKEKLEAITEAMAFLDFAIGAALEGNPYHLRQAHLLIKLMRDANE